MKKKGQAKIITVVLILLLAIITISIFWVIFRALVEKKSSEIDTKQFLLGADIEYFNLTNNYTAEVKIKRSSGGGNITGIKLIFKDYDGNIYFYENKSSYPSELESRIYIISNNSLNISDFLNIEEVSVYYIYKSEVGEKEKITPELDTEKRGSESDGGGAQPRPTPCTNECAEEKLWCDNNRAHNCIIGSDGCLDLIVAECSVNETCINGTGCVIIAGNCTDVDGDGYGVCPNCNISNNCTYNENDCNDSNANIHPYATETCNAIDDDCNSVIDGVDADAFCALLATPYCVNGGCVECRNNTNCIEKYGEEYICNLSYKCQVTPPSCTNDSGCSSEGSFCQESMPFNCSLNISDRCLDRVNGSECETCHECNAGSCIAITSNDGKGCNDDCTYCLAGSCVDRNAHDWTECTQTCYSCTDLVGAVDNCTFDSYTEGFLCEDPGKYCDTGFCCEDLDGDNICDPLNTSIISPNTGDIFLEGESIFFNSTVSGGYLPYNYLWQYIIIGGTMPKLVDFGDTKVLIKNNFTPGDYNVFFTVTDKCDVLRTLKVFC